MHKSLFILLALLPFSFLNAQEYDYDEEEDTTSTKFFIGVNIGAHFSSDKTALQYSGSPSTTDFGIEYYLFERQDLTQTFRDYFIHPFDIEEYPIEPRYQTTLEIGIHMGYQLTRDIAIFMDLNSVQLKYEQFITMSIRDPQNANQLEPLTFEKIPLFGKESRFNFNLGTQISYYQQDATNAYLSVFGNFNAVQLEENYFVIDNIEYQILHPVNGNFNQKPAGVAYGGGGGLGIKFALSESILTDVYYNLYYTQTNLTENLNPYGFHNSIGLRLLWN